MSECRCTDIQFLKDQIDRYNMVFDYMVSASKNAKLVKDDLNLASSGYESGVFFDGQETDNAADIKNSYDDVITAISSAMTGISSAVISATCKLGECETEDKEYHDSEDKKNGGNN